MFLQYCLFHFYILVKKAYGIHLYMYMTCDCDLVAALEMYFKIMLSNMCSIQMALTQQIGCYFPVMKKMSFCACTFTYRSTNIVCNCGSIKVASFFQCVLLMWHVICSCNHSFMGPDHHAL